MAYSRPSIDADGIHIPTYDDIMEYLTDSYKSIFGDDVYLGVDSKDYQMLSIFGKSMDDFAALAVDAYNARNPLYATGDSLDVLCGIVGITRRPSEKAVASLLLTGVNDTVIAAGSKVVDADGGLWTILEDCTISSGTASATAEKDDPGRYGLVAGSISTIYTPVVGWIGVSNVTVGTVGKDTESDEALRVRMRASLQRGSDALPDSINSELLSVEDVEGVSVCVNDTDTTDSRGIPAHSIAALVAGGDEMEIAKAIFGSKAPGIGTAGSVVKSITDTYGQVHTIRFSRPTDESMSVVVSGTVYDARVDLAELRSQIKEAIWNYAQTLGIGEELVVSRLFAAVYSSIQAQGVAITGITVTYTGGTVTTVVPASWDERLVIDSLDDINVSGIVSA